MKRIAAAVAVALAAWGIKCALRGWHDPRRHLLGGQKCATCGKPGADMDALGHDGTLRGMRSFSRENRGEFVRGQWWREAGR